MYKFIIGAFGFLGFAFYQMSGGANFDPVALRESRIEVTPIDEQPLRTVAASPSFDLPSAVQEEATVTRAAFDINADATLTEIAQAAEPFPSPEPAASADAELEAEVTEELILPSLIASDDTPLVATLDIRTIKASRVNVRGGPGTNFNVIGKLKRDTQVEVLKTMDNGWVEMQTTDGKTVGWVADFLLTEG